MNILTLKDATLDYCSDEKYSYFTIKRNGEVTNELQFEKAAVSQNDMLRRALDLIDNYWIDEAGYSHYRYIYQPKDGNFLVSDVRFAIEEGRWQSQKADIVHVYFVHDTTVYILSDYRTNTMKVLVKNNQAYDEYSFELLDGLDLHNKLMSIL